MPVLSPECPAENPGEGGIWVLPPHCEYPTVRQRVKVKGDTHRLEKRGASHDAFLPAIMLFLRRGQACKINTPLDLGPEDSMTHNSFRTPNLTQNY